MTLKIWHFEHGPPRAISESFPFKNHRTMAQVMHDERTHVKDKARWLQYARAKKRLHQRPGKPFAMDSFA